MWDDTYGKKELHINLPNSLIAFQDKLHLFQVIDRGVKINIHTVDQKDSTHYLPPPAIVALIKESNSSSPRMAS